MFDNYREKVQMKTLTHKPITEMTGDELRTAYDLLEKICSSDVLRKDARADVEEQMEAIAYQLTQVKEG